LTGHLKTSKKSSFFWKSEKNVKYVFSNTGPNVISRRHCRKP